MSITKKQLLTELGGEEIAPNLFSIPVGRTQSAVFSMPGNFSIINFAEALFTAGRSHKAEEICSALGVNKTNTTL